MKTVCIVACGKMKIWDKNPNAGKTRAEEAYIGGPTKSSIKYAKKFHPDDWFILSAKYGFLRPDDLIESYNVTFKKKHTNPISVDELSNQIIEKGLGQYDRIVVLGGEDYVEVVKKAFEKASLKKEILTPLAGLRSGERVHCLTEAIQKNEPLY
ncbi:MAG: peroxide stress protein YaaA [Thermoplasmata archaeon]